MAKRGGNAAIRIEQAPDLGGVALEHLDLGMVETIEPEVWAKFLQGCDVNLPAPTSDEFAKSVHEYLQSAQMPAERQEALQYVVDLGTEIGHEAVLQAAEQEGLRLPGDWTRVGPASLVLLLWCQGQEKGECLVVLKAAWIGVANRTRLDKRLKEYSGSGTDQQPSTTPLAQRLRWILGPVLSQKQLILQEVRPREHKNQLTISILFGGREQLHVIANEKRRERVRQRWACCDIARYDYQTDTLAIATRYRSLVDVYRSAIGVALFGTADYFRDSPLWCLESLFDNPEPRLEAARQEFFLQSLTLRRLVWQQGDDIRLTLEGGRVFDFLRNVLQDRQGKLIEAEFEMVRTGFQNNRIRVSLKARNDIGCPPIHRDFASKVMRRIGLIVNRPQEITPWTLAQGVHPAIHFSQAFHDEIDSLAKTGIVAKDTRQFYRDGVQGDSGRILARDGEGGPTFAVSDDEHDLAARSVDSSETEGWVLQREILAGKFAAALGLQGAPQPLLDPWLWDSGFVPGCSKRVRVLLVLCAPPPMAETLIVGTLRARGEERYVLVYPDSEQLSVSLAHVDCDNLLNPPREMLVRILRAGGIDEIPLKILAAGQPLVLIRSTKRVAVFGEEVQLPADQFDLLEALARSSGGGRTAKELVEYMKKRSSPEALRGMRQRLRGTLEAAASKSGQLNSKQALFKKRGQTFGLAVKPVIIDDA